MTFDQNHRYYSLNEYCREQFGEKVYRLSLNGGMSCPNRDGKLDTRGCAFCSAGGSGDFAADGLLPIRDQIAEAKRRIASKTDCRKFIAYFQAFTNTYAPVSYLEDIYAQATAPEDIVALSVGTRCDCLPDEAIDLLAGINRQKPVWVELGLQTIHEKTHSRMSTYTSRESFEDAFFRLHASNIPVVVHLILGLPGETREMMMATLDYVAHLPVFGVKLQLLHVLRGTELATQYTLEPFPFFSLEEYCDLVIDCVERLSPEIVIHRLTGDGPKKLLIAPLWSADKKNVLNTLSRRMRERDAYQGKHFEE
ncbi:MAG: TIGR01212 family radical SAM protein [Lachnospiraceae bacterium]|nr:TIGR01212 family radical SAM protein [Lachnospiraceae bacterium]